VGQRQGLRGTGATWDRGYVGQGQGLRETGAAWDRGRGCVGQGLRGTGAAWDRGRGCVGQRLRGTGAAWDRGCVRQGQGLRGTGATWDDCVGMEAVHRAARKCAVMRGVLLSGISVTLGPAGLSREKASEEGGRAVVCVRACVRVSGCVRVRACVGACACACVRKMGEGGGSFSSRYDCIEAPTMLDAESKWMSINLPKRDELSFLRRMQHTPYSMQHPPYSMQHTPVTRRWRCRCPATSEPSAQRCLRDAAAFALSYCRLSVALTASVLVQQ
jgi:hypothetical protein